MPCKLHCSCRSCGLRIPLPLIPFHFLQLLLSCHSLLPILPLLKPLRLSLLPCQTLLRRHPPDATPLAAAPTRCRPPRCTLSQLLPLRCRPPAMPSTAIPSPATPPAATSHTTSYMPHKPHLTHYHTALVTLHHLIYVYSQLYYHTVLINNASY